MMNTQLDKKQQAANAFVKYLSMNTSGFSRDHWMREIADALKDMAVKYEELSSPSAECSEEWHEYFVTGFKKFIEDLPSNDADLKKALKALNREEVATDDRALVVNTQIQPGPPAGTDKTPDAPAPQQNSNQNANGKRQAESQAADKVTAATEAEAEVQERPAKRVKHGDEDTTTSRGGFTLETEGSLTFRISDDARTSTINLNGRGPAIVTVNVQNKDMAASASAIDNKEATEEGAA